MNMYNEEIVIYGSGGFARELAWLVALSSTGKKEYRVVCFVDDNIANHGKTSNAIPVVSLEEAHDKFPEARIVGGIGLPAARQKVMEKAGDVGFTFATIIHPAFERSSWVEIGAGTVICAGSILTTNIILGQHVQINLNCTIGHDVIIGSYVTLAPGAHISGYVHLGNRVSIGSGAVIVNGTEESPILVGDDVTIGAGACVTKSVPSGLTVVGVPAKPIVRR